VRKLEIAGNKIEFNKEIAIDAAACCARAKCLSLGQEQKERE